MIYFTSIIFGFVHLSNYENESKAFYILAPIIIASQMIGGFILAFIRVRFNLYWSMLYHFLWNLFILIFVVLVYSLSDYNEKTENYSISFSSKSYYEKEKGRSIKVDSTNGKIYKIDISQYSFQHALDTLYQKDKYYIDDSFIELKFHSEKGVTKEEFLEILRKEHDISTSKD